MRLPSELDPELAAALADRYVARLITAWPEGGLAAVNVRSRLAIEVGHLDGDRCLSVTFLGRTTSFSWDGSRGDAEQIIDLAAESHAVDCEGDRWMHGEGWREYGSTVDGDVDG